jgi:hypothetical protein
LTGRLLVKLRTHGVSWSALTTSVAARAGARRSGRDVRQIGLLTVRPRRGDTLRALRARLLRDPRVVRVETETRAPPRLVPNDPALRMPETWPGTPPGTVREWWASPAGFPAAWSLSRGSGVKVAVIDSGIDNTHPDLDRGRVTLAKSFDPEHPDGRHRRARPRDARRLLGVRHGRQRRRHRRRGLRLFHPEREDELR